MGSSMGERLKELRRIRNMTQTEVGRCVRKSKASIYAYEHDINLPPVDVIMRLAGLYKVTSDYLLDNDNKQIISFDGLTIEQEDLLLKINLLLIELLRSKRGGTV